MGKFLAMAPRGKPPCQQAPLDTTVSKGAVLIEIFLPSSVVSPPTSIDDNERPELLEHLKAAQSQERTSATWIWAVLFAFTMHDAEEMDAISPSEELGMVQDQTISSIPASGGSS
jgi:hypothetical protein